MVGSAALNRVVRQTVTHTFFGLTSSFLKLHRKISVEEPKSCIGVFS